MTSFTKRLCSGGLAGVALLVVAASAALAQSYGNFRVTRPVQYNQNNVVVRNGFNARPIYNPYLNTCPYMPYQDPISGYLSGVADTINAEGDYRIQRQQAHVVEEQVKSAKIDNRRKSIDEWLYERSVLPTAEDERERNRLENLRRSHNDPPITEIWSGLALNNLLLDIQRRQGQVGQGPTIPVDADVVSHLNVTSGQGGASIGLFRDHGRLNWPLALKKPMFKKDQERMNELAPQAYRQAVSGPVADETLQGMIDAVANMQAVLSQNIAEFTATDHIRAKRYLTELDSSLKALQDPNVTRYVSGQLAPKGNSVAELIDSMKEQGLRFAPAVAGDQAAYVALHTAMVAYSDRLGAPVAQLKTGKE